MPKKMELISFAIDVPAGTIPVRGTLNYILPLLQLIFTAMLRDKSVFVDGGVQLYRQDETTWLGFSKLSVLRPTTAA